MNEIHTLSGAYAVDAVDEREREMFEQHLQHCSSCRDEVQGLREGAATLTMAVAVAPPAGLRSAVLAGIATTRPLPPRIDTEAGAAETQDTAEERSDEPEPQDEATPDHDVSTVRAMPHRRRRGFIPSLVAAAAVGVAAVGLAVTQPWADDPPGVTVAQQVQQAADARQVRVELADGAEATVTQSAQVGRAVIETYDLPSAPEGRDYQLWLQVGDEFVSAGLIPNQATQTFLLEGDASQAVAAAISVEPTGGSEQPTTEPIAFFDFQGGR